MLTAWGDQSRLTDSFAEAAKLPIVWLRLQGLIEKAAQQEVRPAREASDLVDAGLAHGKQTSVVLEDGAVHFQRTPALDRHDRFDRVPEKDVVLLRCRLHRVRILEGHS